MSKTLNIQVACAARKMLVDRHSWTQHEVARTSVGRPCTSLDPAASAFCLVGAVQASAFRVGANVGRTTKNVIDNLEAILVKRGDGRSCAQFNDSASHEDVLDLLDALIAA